MNTTRLFEHWQRRPSDRRVPKVNTIERQKQSLTVNRSRDCLQKAQEAKVLRQIDRDKFMTLKHLRQREVLYERKMKRLDLEKNWTKRIFEPSHIATAYTKSCPDFKQGKPIREMKLRNIGSIYFEKGAYTPRDHTIGRRASTVILGELERLQETGKSLKTRRVTITAHKDDNDMPDIDLPDIPHDYNRTNQSSINTFLSSLNRRMTVDVPRVGLNDIVEEIKKERSMSLPLVAQARPLSRPDKSDIAVRVVSRLAETNKSQDQPESNEKNDQLIELLTHGPSFSLRDAKIIVEYLNECRNGLGYSEEMENVARLERIINSWRMKSKKWRRAMKDTDSTADYWESDADWHFILGLINRLRGEGSRGLLTPIEVLRCRYLRLSDTSVAFLEKMCHSMGVDPGIHPYSKSSTYDIRSLDMFKKEDSTSEVSRRTSGSQFDIYDMIKNILVPKTSFLDIPNDVSNVVSNDALEK